MGDTTVVLNVVWSLDRRGAVSALHAASVDTLSLTQCGCQNFV